jgi:hypothetical protein
MKIYLLIAVGSALTLFTIGLRLNRFSGNEDSWFSYRSSLARKNDDTWYEGNQFAGRMLMLFSVLLIALVLFFFLNQYPVRVIVYSLSGGLFFTLVAVYFLTERYLRDIFFRDGKRKPKF